MGGIGHAWHFQVVNEGGKGPPTALPHQCTRFNDQKHTVARNNCHWPYPKYYQVKARTEATQHKLEKFNDLFLKDQIWAARDIWAKQVQMIKTTPFQEAFLMRGLEEYTIPGDSVLDTVSVPIHYAAVIGGECLEAITDLDDKVIHHDLMVRYHIGSGLNLC